jgi:hypothetical protein
VYLRELLRQHVEGKRENLEDTLRRVLREELARQNCVGEPGKTWPL